MKNKAILFVIGLGFVLSSSACNKCKECTKANASIINYCEYDFDSQIQYDLAVRDAEYDGYVCTEVK